ncbi:MAG TPA: hypothetical protein VK151_17995 [Fluviicola sp.]|nr:hypothetical protein [Fluviicola sp.]
MDLFKQLVLAGFIVITLPVTGQISSGKVEEKTVIEEEDKPEKAEKPARVPTEGMDEFVFYFGAGRVYANRNLESNKEPFGAPLGARADETGLKAWSFQAGVRNRVSRFISYDAGFALDRFGESYEYDDPDTDSTFSYTSRYSYYAMPIQVFFTYGKDLRVFAGGGIQPQLLAGFRQEQKWNTTLGSTGEATLKGKDGFNEFGMGLIMSCGFQWRLNRNTSLYVLPSWVWNLTSTFDDQSDYIHKAESFNLKFGITVHLKQP